LKKLRPNHLGDIFRKHALNAQKYCPKGKISPNLVTQVTTDEILKDTSIYKMSMKDPDLHTDSTKKNR
jgi:hypothetical protein